VGREVELCGRRDSLPSVRTIGNSKQTKLENGASPRTTRGPSPYVPHRKPLGQFRPFSPYVHGNDAKIAIRAGLIVAGPGAGCVYSWAETDYTASGGGNGNHYLWLKVIVDTTTGLIASAPTIEHFAAADIATAAVHGQTYAGRLLCKYTVRDSKVVYTEDLWRKGEMTIPVYCVEFTSTAWYASDSFHLDFGIKTYAITEVDFGAQSTTAAQFISADAITLNGQAVG
jgi:hypothetical protein